MSTAVVDAPVTTPTPKKRAASKKAEVGDANAIDRANYRNADRTKFLSVFLRKRAAGFAVFFTLVETADGKRWPTQRGMDTVSPTEEKARKAFDALCKTVEGEGWTRRAAGAFASTLDAVPSANGPARKK